MLNMRFWSPFSDIWNAVCHKMPYNNMCTINKDSETDRLVLKPHATTLRQKFFICSNYDMIYHWLETTQLTVNFYYLYTLKKRKTLNILQNVRKKEFVLWENTFKKKENWFKLIKWCRTWSLFFGNSYSVLKRSKHQKFFFAIRNK